MRYLAIIVFVFFRFTGHAQIVRHTQHVNNNEIGKFISDDNSKYSVLRKIINANQPISYFGGLPVTHGFDRATNLSGKEGANSQIGGHVGIIEGNVDLVFPLIGGRPQTTNGKQGWMFSFHYNPALRMYSDYSLPVLPTNQKVGVQLNKRIYASILNPTSCTNCKNEKFQLDNTSWGQSDIKFVYLLLNAMHYSNGQQDSAIRYPGNHNNYTSGNFSTNFVNASLTYSRYNSRSHCIFTSSVGIQLDGTFPAEFEETQINRYGQVRALGMLQLQSGIFSLRGGSTQWAQFAVDEDCTNIKCVDLHRGLVANRARLEMEYIIGNVSDYPHQYKSRFNVHLFDEIQPLRWRTAGLFIHLYWGRDYMNIRYDDIIFLANAGLTFNFSKYRDIDFDHAPIQGH